MSACVLMKFIFITHSCISLCQIAVRNLDTGNVTSLNSKALTPTASPLLSRRTVPHSLGYVCTCIHDTLEVYENSMYIICVFAQILDKVTSNVRNQQSQIGGYFMHNAMMRILYLIIYC